MLREGRRLRVADLVDEFGVTDTSIRRDLAILEANGVRYRGQVVLKPALAEQWQEFATRFDTDFAWTRASLTANA